MENNTRTQASPQTASKPGNQDCANTGSQSPRQDLENTLRSYLSDTRGRAFLRSLDEAGILSVADDLIQKDQFGDIDLLDHAIYGVWGEHGIREYISHVIWCAHREALHSSEQTTHEAANARPDITVAPNTSYEINGVGHLLSTAGKPTIIICPMTLCTDDIMNLILSVFDQHQPSRPIIFYGEDMDSYLGLHPEHRPLFAGADLSGIRRILGVLKAGGVFLTYPDFVYDKHQAASSSLFGKTRPISSGLLKIAAHSGATLLPAAARRKEDAIAFSFFGAVPQPSMEVRDQDGVDGRQRQYIQEQVLSIVIGRLLEALILEVPFQWRLLPTLSHEAAGMATAT